jgi:hypothetical protein
MKKEGSDLVAMGKQTDFDEWRYAWDALVDRYTSTKVTFDRDRWIAFSGLASTVQRACGLTLTAGLSREQFPLELAWESDHFGRRINSELPTWSWISLENAV